MKVLHVVGSLGKGGDTTAVINIYEYILKNSIDITFEFLTHQNFSQTYVNKLNKRGIKVNFLSGDVRKIGPVKYYLEIKKFLNYHQYDAIHFHTSFQSAVGIIASKKCGIKKIICHSHTTAVQRKTNPLAKLLFLPVCRFLINRFATVKVGCSIPACKYLFGKKNKYLVIYNGIDINEFKKINLNKKQKLLKEFKVNENTKVIGQVGRISDMKNPMFTMEIAKRLKDENFVFVFVGTGDLHKDCEELKSKMKLTNVCFVGQVEDVNNYMSVFDYLVLPSKYGEGLPVVLTEEQVINPYCLCICNSNITEEANLGNVIYNDINNVDEWVNIIKTNTIKPRIIDYTSFDINNSAKKWINLYK